MKNSSYIKCVLLSVIVLGICGRASAQNSPIGVWWDENKEGRIEIFQCKSGICGKLVWFADSTDAKGKPKTDIENPDKQLRNRPLKDLVIITGMQPASAGLWEEGRIYDPQSGNTYRATMKLESADKLKLHGYIGFSWIGRSTVWTRYKP